MDPLTALGLASNVFSFVSFASGLIKGTLEISASTTGCNIDIARLDTVCEKLQVLCKGLQSCMEHEIPEATGEHDVDDVTKIFAVKKLDDVTEVFIAVKELCATCKVDGDELLRVTKTLKTKNGSKGKWDSFRVALRKAWEKASIDELETRLSRTQGTMTLHICTLV